MTFDDDVIAAGKKALDEFGAGTTGSRVLNGTFQGHKECEDALKEFYGMDHAMVFSTGYQAIMLSSISIVMRQSMMAVRWAMPRLSPSATMMLRRWKSG
jgi:7-keto-8-aminopelargonate synthetase-like enzyme